MPDAPFPTDGADRPIRAPRLFTEIEQAKGEGRHLKFLAALAKADLLILDDWGLAALDDGQRRDLLEIMDDRHINRSTLITSQLPVENWHEDDQRSVDRTQNMT